MYLYNICPRCERIDEVGTISYEVPTSDPGMVGYDHNGYQTTRNVCNTCWGAYVSEVTKIQHLQDDLDATFEELYLYPPFEYFRRGLITAEELRRTITEKLDKAIDYAIMGDAAL